jgi:hypothetical protein
MLAGGTFGRSLGSATVSLTSLPPQALKDNEGDRKRNRSTALVRKPTSKGGSFLAGEFIGG